MCQVAVLAGPEATADQSLEHLGGFCQSVLPRFRKRLIRFRIQVLAVIAPHVPNVSATPVSVGPTATGDGNMPTVER